MITSLVSLVVRPSYFRMIREGRKVVEGRLKKPELENLKIHDIIQFKTHAPQKQEEVIHVKVTYLNSYATFQKMLEKEGLHRCLPDAQNLEEGVNTYYSFPSYREYEKLYGVIAIGIQILKSGGRL